MRGRAEDVKDDSVSRVTAPLGVFGSFLPLVPQITCRVPWSVQHASHYDLTHCHGLGLTTMHTKGNKLVFAYALYSFELSLYMWFSRKSLAITLQEASIIPLVQELINMKNKSNKYSKGSVVSFPATMGILGILWQQLKYCRITVRSLRQKALSIQLLLLLLFWLALLVTDSCCVQYKSIWTEIVKIPTLTQCNIYDFV